MYAPTLKSKMLDRCVSDVGNRHLAKRPSTQTWCRTVQLGVQTLYTFKLKSFKPHSAARTATRALPPRDVAAGVVGGGARWLRPPRPGTRAAARCAEGGSARRRAESRTRAPPPRRSCVPRSPSTSCAHTDRQDTNAHSDTQDGQIGKGRTDRQTDSAVQ